MAEVKFMPVCMSCGGVIRDELVDVSYEECVVALGDKGYVEKHLRIVPESCPFCGEKFDSLTIQTNLPFWPENRKNANGKIGG